LNNHNKIFGLAIRTLRKSKKITQDELAYTASLDRTYISLLELGSNSPSLDTITLLCNALEVSLVDLALLMDSISTDETRQ